MMIGLSTYAYFWQISERASVPLPLEQLLKHSHYLDAQVFQICDYPQLPEYSDDRLRDLKKLADDFGVVLELGTKGVKPLHLASYLRIADILGAKVIRSMVNAQDHRPSLVEAETLLKQSMPAYEASGVKLALETYEQLSSKQLVTLVEAVGSESLGICLDPANCVAALENPVDVIDRCAPYVVNLHIKDFAFTRRGGWVGFTLEGVELGKGLLPYDYMIEKINPDARGINQVVEHWLSWRDDFETTKSLENEWNQHNLARMRGDQATSLDVFN